MQKFVVACLACFSTAKHAQVWLSIVMHSPHIIGGASRPKKSIRKYPVSGNIRYPEILGIQKYPVSGIIWYPVSGHIQYLPGISGNIRYPEISGIRKYLVSGNIRYPELSRISGIRKYPKSGKI